MILKELFARTNTGAIQSWTVEVEYDQFRTVYGQVGGKFQTTNWTKCYPTNEGRSNERNAEQQALFEAEALWKKKKESGYYEHIDDVDKQVFIEPMLAKKFEDYHDELVYPLYNQPKLDGLRCVITNTSMKSRNGKTYNSCPHILEQLQSFFLKHPDVVLDGELYNHTLKHDFNKITSLVKKTKPTKQDLIESSNIIQYWVYDCILPNVQATFQERIVFLREELQDLCSIIIVPTFLAPSKEVLDLSYETYIHEGYEGQMIRMNRAYENKRSKYLLKRKEFQDQEYVILDIIEGEGNKSGMAGAMVFKNECGYEFNSNIKGSREYLQELWHSKQELIGKLATVQFFNKTPPPRLVPRFPYVIRIRDSFDL